MIKHGYIQQRREEEGYEESVMMNLCVCLAIGMILSVRHADYNILARQEH